MRRRKKGEKKGVPVAKDELSLRTGIFEKKEERRLSFVVIDFFRLKDNYDKETTLCFAPSLKLVVVIVLFFLS